MIDKLHGENYALCTYIPLYTFHLLHEVVQLHWIHNIATKPHNRASVGIMILL